MQKVKIVCISDTHLCDIQNIGLEPADILIHAGDWTKRGTMTEIDCFYSDLLDISHMYDKVLVTPGNHDIIVESQAELITSLFYSKNIECLIDESYNYKGINFYFSPFANKFGNWAFMKEAQDIDSVWDKIPINTDILVTHGPPYGQLDIVDNYGMPEHVGCGVLLKKVRKVKPKVHIFGHIHESNSYMYRGDTLYVNCSIYGEKHRPTNRPYIITLTVDSNNSVEVVDIKKC